MVFKRDYSFTLVMTHTISLFSLLAYEIAEGYVETGGCFCYRTEMGSQTLIWSSLVMTHQYSGCFNLKQDNALKNDQWSSENFSLLTLFKLDEHIYLCLLMI